MRRNQQNLELTRLTRGRRRQTRQGRASPDHYKNSGGTQGIQGEFRGTVLPCDPKKLDKQGVLTPNVTEKSND